MLQQGQLVVEAKMPGLGSQRRHRIEIPRGFQLGPLWQGVCEFFMVMGDAFDSGERANEGPGNEGGQANTDGAASVQS